MDVTTRTGLEQFQIKNNLTTSGGVGYGVLGPKTRTAINNLTQTTGTPTSNLTQAQRTALITKLEAILQDLIRQLEALIRARG